MSTLTSTTIQSTPAEFAANPDFARQARRLKATATYSRDLLTWGSRATVIAAVTLVRAAIAEAAAAKRREAERHLSDAVRGIAAELVRTSDWSLLPILADALQEAGWTGDLGGIQFAPERIARHEYTRAVTALRAALLTELATTLDSQWSALKAQVVNIADWYHLHIRALYTSSRADVAYGAGGARQTDWKAYSKRYGFPANWQDAGVRIIGEQIVIETSRGTEVARLPMPPAGAEISTGPHPGLLNVLFVAEGVAYTVGRSRGSKIHDCYVVVE
jgi:hypothetical protein